MSIKKKEEDSTVTTIDAELPSREEVPPLEDIPRRQVRVVETPGLQSALEYAFSCKFNKETPPLVFELSLSQDGRLFESN